MTSDLGPLPTHVLREYPGKFVALFNQQVVASGSDATTCYRNLAIQRITGAVVREVPSLSGTLLPRFPWQT